MIHGKATINKILVSCPLLAWISVREGGYYYYIEYKKMWKGKKSVLYDKNNSSTIVWVPLAPLSTTNLWKERSTDI